jgi:endoglucanase
MSKESKKKFKFYPSSLTCVAVFCVLFLSTLSISINNGSLGAGGNDPEPMSAGPPLNQTDMVTGVSSSRIILDWDDVPGASGYNVYYAPEPRYLGDDNNRKMDAAGIAASTHTITKLSPLTNVFIMVEVIGTAADDLYDHAKTLGGPRAVLESAVREVHMAAPDIIEIVFADYRTVYDGSSLVGNDGAAWQSATWTITRLDGNPINVQTTYRKSIPVSQPDWGYNKDTWGDKDNDIVDLDHHIYLKLDQDVLSNPITDTGELLNIKTTDGPTGTLEFNMVFSDNYLEGPIDVNQVAYSPTATERYAYVQQWMGDGGPVPVTSYQNNPACVLYEPANILEDRGIVLSGINVIKRNPEKLGGDGKDEASGTDVGSIDISDPSLVMDNRNYRVKIPGVGVSWPTQVSNLGFLKAVYVTLRGFDANGWYRSIEEAFWGPYIRPLDEYSDQGTRSHGWAYIPPSNLENYDWKSDFDFNVMIDGNGDPLGTKIPVRGGFHDAGDFDIRPTHTMIPIDLFAAYELNPNAFTDGQLDIEESGNGIPDLLDLALWGGKAFEDIQRSDGGVSMGVQTDGHPQQYFYANNDILKSHHPGYPGLKPHWTYAPSAAISAIASGFFAKGAYFVGPYNATRAAELETKAIDAYTYAKNNGASTHTKIYGAGELWRLTGESQYKTDFESFWDAGAWNYETGHYDEYRGSSNYVAGDVALPQFVDAYASMPQARSDIVDGFKADLIKVSNERVYDTENRHGHRNNRPVTNVGYGLGYSVGHWTEATISLLMFDDLNTPDTGDEEAKSRQEYINMISLNADFLLGTNPLSHVPMSGLGTIDPKEPLWHDALAFNKQFDLPMIPGYSVFGPFDDFTADGYYAEAGAGFYPDHNDFPLMNNYADVRTWVRTSEGTSHKTQTSHAMLYCALLGEGLAVPDSWKPGGSDFLNGLPGTGGGSPPPPPPANNLPVANAGNDQTTIEDQTVNFDGSGSYDSDGFIIDYSWDFGDSNFGSGENPDYIYNDPGVYTVTLTVTDDDGDTDQDSCTITVNQRPLPPSINLVEGWNLISFPYDVVDNGLQTVLSSIDGKYDSVQYYDSSDFADPWKHYHINKPGNLNDLNQLDNTMGFWIHITDPSGANLVVDGDIPSIPHDITLNVGWNLVGLPRTDYITVSEVRSGLIGPISIFKVNPLGGPQDLINLDFDDVMSPTEGFWIHSPIIQTWTVANGGAREYDVDANTLALWHLNDNLDDETGHGYTFGLQGSAQISNENTNWMDSPSGKSLKFTGYQDKAMVSIPRSALWNSATDVLDFEAKMYIEAYDAWSFENVYIMGMYQRYDHNILFYDGKWEDAHIRIENPTNETYIMESTQVTSDVPLGEWFQINLVLGWGQAFVYINEQLVATLAMQPEFEGLNDPIEIWFGGFVGYVDEIRISNIDRNIDP